MVEPQIEKFLELVEPLSKSNRFCILTREKGITVLKQQMRALNLMYSLRATDRILRGQNIAIIGAGAAGVTAAAAAFILGYRVHLFEKSQLYCHLQQGCETRWIHPHLYDWPEPGSDRAYAGLPFLDWRAGTAAEVIVQITNEFERIIKRKSENFHFTWGVDVTFPSERRLKWTGRYQGEEEFDAVIFAIGFGIERVVPGAEGQKSYWRNDSLNQAVPGQLAGTKRTIFISGTGDGGLIELIRSTVNNYNQGRIIRELLDGEEKLIKELQRISREWKTADLGGVKATWLYDQYQWLFNRNYLKKLIKTLRLRIRNDTKPILNGPVPRFAMALNLDTGSVLNTLLVFCLEKSSAFGYLPGRCSAIDAKNAIVNGKKIKADKFIIRHGPDTSAACDAAKFSEASHVLGRKTPVELDTSARLWPAGWWGERAHIYLGKSPIEFVNPATLAIANTFVATLSDVVKLRHTRKNPQFRIALHRVIRVNEGIYFQQISRYAGTRSAGPVGRVFNISAGLVGLSCRLGTPVTVKRDRNFRKIWDRLELQSSKARPVDGNVKSLLACPFFAPVKAGDTARHISLILFMDSAEDELFNPEVLELIYGACKGFVENVEEMGRSNEITFESSDFRGLRARSVKTDREIVSQYDAIDTENRIFKHYKKDLTFQTVSTFEAELNRFRYDSA